MFERLFEKRKKGYIRLFEYFYGIHAPTGFWLGFSGCTPESSAQS